MKIILAFVTTVLFTVSPLHAQQYETSGNFKAAQFAPPALLKGALYTVDENVSVEGGLPRFTIRSKYGTWEARGVEMLAIRTTELPAFEQLEKVSKSSEFGKAVGNAVAAPIKTTGQFIQKPVETTGNMLSGIGIMAGRVGRVAGSAATRVGDSATGAQPPQQAILKPIAPEAGTAAPRSFTGDPLGYNKTRREWAQRVGVDPYTTNALLSDKLSEFARVSFAGSAPVNVGLGVAVAPLHYATQTNETAQLETYQLSPVDIESRNEARLRAMGIEGLTVRTLFRNAYFTPTLQTALVLALESLGQVSGRDDVVAFAGRATSESEARYVNNSVLMLARSAASVGQIARVRGAGNVIAAETRDGKLVIAAPIDYVAWVEAADIFGRRTDLSGSGRWLLISGKASPRAVKELSALGWRVNDNLAAAK